MADEVPAGLVSNTTDRTIQNLIQQVRLYLRDYPQLNRLTAGVENGERFIAWGIQDAISDWNSAPPVIGTASVANHPAPHLLVRRAAAAVLEGVMHLQMRNHLNYSDGSGSSVQSSDKAPQLQAVIQGLLARYERDRDKMKIALNIAGGWGGGIHSELLHVGGYYGLG